MAALVITESEVNAFRVELDQYDAAAIEALHENEAALIRVLARKEELLAKAYVLPDGRRVFKSEDGIRVFDEHGMELDVSSIDPDLIDETHPLWETYKPILEESIRLEEQRRALLDYQARLDEARERLDAGDLTREEFDRLREELTAEMPDAVKAHVAGLENEPSEPKPSDPVAGQDTDLVIEDDMVPSQLPGGPAPA